VESDIDFKNKMVVTLLDYGWSKLTGEYFSFLLQLRYYGSTIPCIRPSRGMAGRLRLKLICASNCFEECSMEKSVEVWGSGNKVEIFVPY